MTTVSKIPIFLTQREWFRDQYTLRIYIVLLTAVDAPIHNYRFRTGECFFTYKRLAKEIRITMPKLLNRLKKIQSSGDIKIEKTERRGWYRATIPEHNEPKSL